jgi:hypothetical protein
LFAFFDLPTAEKSRATPRSRADDPLWADYNPELSADGPALNLMKIVTPGTASVVLHN